MEANKIFRSYSLSGQNENERKYVQRGAKPIAYSWPKGRDDNIHQKFKNQLIRKFSINVNEST